MSDGYVDGDNLMCGVHMWDYRLDTGVSEYSNDEALMRFKAWVEDDGVWVTGLPNKTKIITVGQELVVSGERVDPVLVNTSLATSSASSLTQAGS